ncbi:MAG: PP2C family serine/threonine-protein phosphatase, partial [Candidatus Eisenbacteria bacterium]
MDSVQKFQVEHRFPASLCEAVGWRVVGPDAPANLLAQNGLNLLRPRGTMPRAAFPHPTGLLPRRDARLNPAQFSISTAAATDVGRKRSGNEDSHALWAAQPGEAHVADRLLVVCDGMGGSNAGEVASRMAVEIVLRELQAAPADDLPTALARAIHTANHEIWDQACAHHEQSGMGTTCTVIALRGDEALVGHVGDSRAYLVRGGQARQITTDHSLVAQLVARQQITLEEAKLDPRRNVVTRSVGVSAEIEVDVVAVGEPLRDRDTLVACSDGLHGLVSDAEIASLAAGDSLDDACRA